jgi:hypothetical protein
VYFIYTHYMHGYLQIPREVRVEGRGKGDYHDGEGEGGIGITG